MPDPSNTGKYFNILLSLEYKNVFSQHMRVQIASEARQREHRRQKYDHRVAFEFT